MVWWWWEAWCFLLELGLLARRRRRQKDALQKPGRVLVVLHEPAHQGLHKAVAFLRQLRRSRVCGGGLGVQVVAPLLRPPLRLWPRLLLPPLRGGKLPGLPRAPFLVFRLRLQALRPHAVRTTRPRNETPRQATHYPGTLNGPDLRSDL